MDCVRFRCPPRWRTQWRVRVSKQFSIDVRHINKNIGAVVASFLLPDEMFNPNAKESGGFYE